VLIYCFSIHNTDGGAREVTGRMALADDNAARAFGKAIIRDLMHGDARQYAGWTMDVMRAGPWTLPKARVRFAAFRSRTFPGTNPGRRC
jgi:hypothetical protein